MGVGVGFDDDDDDRWVSETMDEISHRATKVILQGSSSSSPTRPRLRRPKGSAVVLDRSLILVEG